MNRRAFIRHLSSLAFIIAAIFASANASAQQTCTIYRVDVEPSVMTCAFPITVTTNWGNPPGPNHNVVINNHGSFNIPAPNPPGVWVPPFNWVSLNGGGVPRVPLWGTNFVKSGCACLRVEVALLVNGCIHIKIAHWGGAC